MTWHVDSEISGIWDGSTIVTVGASGRDYTDIDAAVIAAASGTLILVDPGNYSWDARTTKFTKDLLIRGLGTSPTDTIIQNTVPTQMLKSSGKLVIENVYLINNVAWYHCVVMEGSGTFFINKTRIYGPGASNPLIGAAHDGEFTGSLIARNSYLDMGFCHIGGNNNRDLDLTLCRFQKMLLDQNFYPYNTINSLAEADWVATPTSDYGYEYGDYLIYGDRGYVSFPRKLEVAYPEGNGRVSQPRAIEVAYKTDYVFDGYDVDSNTKTLVHFDGPEGSTTITDECGTAWECRRQAHLTTATKKYGSASIVFDGYDDYAVWTGSAGAITGVNYGQFTIDFWIITADTDGSILYQGPYTGWSANETMYMMDMVNGYFVWTVNPAAVPSHQWLASSARIDNTGWRHIACVRDGTTWKLFIDGVIQGTKTGLTFNVEQSIYAMVFGGYAESVGYPRYFVGCIDEFRFSDTARWSEDFSLQSAKEQYESHPRKLEVAYPY